MLRRSAFFLKKKGGDAAESSSSARVHAAKTNHPRVFTLDAPGPQSKGVALLISWLYSQPKYVARYAEIYREMDFDVVFATPTWTHVMNPPRALELVRAAEEHTVARLPRAGNDNVVVHCFSMGAYLTSLLTSDMRERNSPMLPKIRGQVVDSGVDYDFVPIGTARATFNNVAAQNALEKGIRTFLNAFPTVKAEHVRCSNNFWHKPLQAPSLWYYSSSDVISPADVCEKVMATWKAESGIESRAVHFPDSKHVTHFKLHPEQYKTALQSFLREEVLKEKQATTTKTPPTTT